MHESQWFHQVWTTGRFLNQEHWRQACPWCCNGFPAHNPDFNPWECAGLWGGLTLVCKSEKSYLQTRRGLQIPIYSNQFAGVSGPALEQPQPAESDVGSQDLSSSLFQCWTHHNIQLQTFIPWTKNLFQIWVCLWHQGYAHASSGTPTGVSVCGVSCTTRIWKNGLHPFLWGSWQTSSSPLWSPVCIWVSRHTCGPPQLTKKENLWRRMSCQGASTMQFQKHMVIWFKPIPISPSQYVSSAGASRSICDSSVAVVLTSSCMISVPIPPRDAVLKPLIAACLVWLQVLNSGHLSEELEKQFLNYTISVNLILK